MGEIRKVNVNTEERDIAGKVLSESGDNTIFPMSQSAVTQYFSQENFKDYFILLNGYNYNGLYVFDNTITLSKSGFNIIYDNVIYLIKADVDITYTFPNKTYSEFFVIDCKKLSEYDNNTIVVTSTDKLFQFISYQTLFTNKDYKIIAYKYGSSTKYNVTLCDKFKNIFSEDTYFNIYPMTLSYSNIRVIYWDYDELNLYVRGFTIKLNKHTDIDLTIDQILAQLNQAVWQKYIHINDYSSLIFNENTRRFRIVSNDDLMKLTSFDHIILSTNSASIESQRLSYVINSLSEIKTTPYYEVSTNNKNIDAVTIARNGNIVFNSTGFSVKLYRHRIYFGLPDNIKYYSIKIPNVHNFLCLNIVKIVNDIIFGDFSSNIRYDVRDYLITAPNLYSSHIPIAKYVDGNVLWSQFDNIFRKDQYNINEIVFLPDFYSVSYGKSDSEWFSRFKILHMSDTHGSYKLISEALNTGQMAADIICNTGDYIDGITDVSGTEDVLNKYSQTVRAFNSKPIFSVIGNHDANITKQSYFQIMTLLMEEFQNDIVWGDNEHFRNYGYVDITPNTVCGTFRIIMLDTRDTDLSVDKITHQSCLFSQKQINWFISTIRDAADKQIKVITMSHYSWSNNTVYDDVIAKPDCLYFQNAFMLPDIIDAAQHKSVLNKSYSDSSVEKFNITVNEDFSTLTYPLEFVVHLFGHMHSKNIHQCQKADGSKKYDILMLGEHALWRDGFALNNIRHNGTSDIAFSVLEIDPIEKCIYRVSYGAYKNYDGSPVERVTKIPYRFVD